MSEKIDVPDFEFVPGDRVRYGGKIEQIDERVYRVDNIGDSGFYYRLDCRSTYYVRKERGEERFELISERSDTQ